MAESSSSTRFAPPKFQGLTTENAKDWIHEFDNYCLYKDMNGAKKLALFKVLLTSSAAIWLENLPATTTNSWENVKAAFETRYNPRGFLKYKHANDLFNKKQGSMSVDDFCAQMQRLAREVGAAEDMLRFAVINGFNLESRGRSSRPGSPARRVRFDRSADRGVQEYRNTGPREDRRSRSSDRQPPNNNNNWDNRGRPQRWDAGPPNRSRSGGFRGRGFNQRQGQFNYSSPRTFDPQNGVTPNFVPQNFPNFGQPQFMAPTGQPIYAPPPPTMETGRNGGQRTDFTPITMQCGKCGRSPHQHPNMCPAVNNTCHGYGRKGHFLRVCRTTVRQQNMQQAQ